VADATRSIHMKPKLLVLTSTFPRWAGDSEPAFVLDLSRRLRDWYSVLVLAPHGPKLKRREFLGGVEVVRFRYFFEPWERLAYQGGILAALKTRRWTALLLPLFLWSELMAAARLIRREPIALIHAHWLLPQGLLALIARRLAGRRVPVLCTSHGGDLYALRDPLSTALKRWALRRVDALSVVSRAMRETVLTLYRRVPVLEVVPMGVDLEGSFTPAPESTVQRTRTILFVGRLVEKKGLRFLLEAFARIQDEQHGQDQRHPWELHVVGAGPLRPELERLALRLGVAARVRFLGGVENRRLPDLYRRAVMAVFPFVVGSDGDREGFGLVVVEALGCGCPVIAGEVPAVRDIITHGETGLLVPPGDAAALALAMRRLIADPDLGRRLARAGRERARTRFDWRVIASRYHALFQTLLGTNASDSH